jgi:Cu2+-exporting ATPase
MKLEASQSVSVPPANLCGGGKFPRVSRERPRPLSPKRTDFDLDAFVVVDANSVASLTLLIENVHCAGCIARIERHLKSLSGVVDARVNFSTRRVRIEWLNGQANPDDFLRTLEEIGYPARPFDASTADRAGAREERELLRCLAVAGFAAANIMLLSVSIWSGSVSDMPDTTRNLFHWVSALIALPTVAYAGRPFFRSAWTALSARGVNMDVPIALAVTLATGMSLVETVRGGEHAYFDAAVALLFFLLVGRYLDRRMRSRARSAAERLLALNPTQVMILDGNGISRAISIDAVVPGMLVQSFPGDRIPVDGVIESGDADIDAALLTGEAIPFRATKNSAVHAGTINLNGSLVIRVGSAGADTVLSGIVRLVEAAEQGRARYVRLADRVSRVYAPVVHVLALGTFLGWWLVGGSPVWSALMAAVAVLIITCPCALGLAVPAVQVAAVGRLLRCGVLVKSGDALERLASVDTVVFDKTGTLTEGRPQLTDTPPIESAAVVRAAALAARSRHPAAQAFASTMKNGSGDVSEVEEVPGAGMRGFVDGVAIRIGSARFCDAISTAEDVDDASELWIRSEQTPPLRLRFHDRPRDDAEKAVRALLDMGLKVELISGDRPGAVEAVANACGIVNWHASCLPAQKVALLEAAKAEGRKVLMVGDGINDAPAIAAATAGMSPGSAASVSQIASDLVFLGGRLESVVDAYRIAQQARQRVRQNFILAIGYNIFAVPIAMAGLATPLIAAVAMSCSSILVTINAARLSVRLRAE